MIEKYMKQKTMQPLKKILGAGLLISGISMFLNLEFILNYLNQYDWLMPLFLVVSGYFLFISGRRQ